jgi:hypothetical protein
MNLIGKEFQEIGTGHRFTILDAYSDVAVTSDKERVSVRRLLDPKYYNQGSDIVNERSDAKKFEITLDDDFIDPNKFLNKDRTYSFMADAIKSIPEDKLPKEDINVTMPASRNIPSMDDSAVIIDNDYDERAELMRKYGLNNNNNLPKPDLNSHNEKFSKFLDEDDNIQRIEANHNHNSQAPVGQNEFREVSREYDGNMGPITKIEIHQDPIITMFKNVKRNIDFSVEISIKNKIPRADFIEMMEDSYETSIIDFLAEEFTNNILKNPNIIKDIVKDKIKTIVYGEQKSTEDSKPQSRPIQKGRRVVKKDKPKENTEAPKKPIRSSMSKRVIPPPPTPPNDRVIQEGKEPTPPSKNKNTNDK